MEVWNFYIIFSSNLIICIDTCMLTMWCVIVWIVNIFTNAMKRINDYFTLNASARSAKKKCSTKLPQFVLVNIVPPRLMSTYNKMNSFKVMNI